jgi:negative regulator of sigma E activity
MANKWIDYDMTFRVRLHTEMPVLDHEDYAGQFAAELAEEIRAHLNESAGEGVVIKNVERHTVGGMLTPLTPLEESVDSPEDTQ